MLTCVLDVTRASNAPAPRGSRIRGQPYLKLAFGDFELECEACRCEASPKEAVTIKGHEEPCDSRAITHNIYRLNPSTRSRISLIAAPIHDGWQIINKNSWEVHGRFIGIGE